MKTSIRVSNLTLDLYLDYVRPAAIKAGLLENAITEDGKPYYITDEAIAKEIDDNMRCACFNAGYDGIKRTHEEYVEHEAEQMLNQIEVSIKYSKNENIIEALRTLYDAIKVEVECTKAERMVKAISEKVEQTKARSAWGKGVKEYAEEMLEEMEFNAKHGYVSANDLSNKRLFEKALLNGADSWSQYSWGGSALIYDRDIAERLCNPSELKRTRNGERRPNSREEWLDTQARALGQAAWIILHSWDAVCGARV